MPNRTLARLRLTRMQMRRRGQLLTQGHKITPSEHTDIRATFRRVRKQQEART